MIINRPLITSHELTPHCAKAQLGLQSHSTCGGTIYGWDIIHPLEPCQCPCHSGTTEMIEILKTMEERNKDV